MTPPVTVEEFKARFVREFPYGDDPSSAVTDPEITNALNDATLMFNESMWDAGVEVKTAFLFLAAHFLTLNVQAAGGLGLQIGLESAGGAPINSRSVGSVSLSHTLPESVTNSPILSQFMRTDFGCRYLQMAAPRLVGNMTTVAGFNDTGFGPVG